MKKAKKAEKKAGYVIPLGRGWVVKTTISGKLFVVTDNKRDAVSIARGIAKRYASELIIYDKEGRVATTTSYAGKKRIVAKA